MAALQLLQSVHADNDGNDANCTNGTQWILNLFGQCVNTPELLIGFILGFVSLLLWIVPIFPQVYENYKRQRCDGLSIIFLLLWIGGDTCNVVGAFLSHQLPMQKIIGVYYILVDVILLGQYFYYEQAASWRARMWNDLGSSRAVIPCLFLLSAFSFTGNYLLPSIVATRQVDYSTEFKSRRLLGHFFQDAQDEIGYIIGTVSAICYFAGRVPQIYKNYKRQSTEGVSAAMFAIIVFANLTYGLSIILAGQGWHYILEHMPWLLGSIGCCFCDAIVLLQYMKYYRRPADERDELEKLLADQPSSPSLA